MADGPAPTPTGDRTMPTPREVPEVLDRDFLEIRSRILDIAAALDRLDRASVPAGEPAHPARRLAQIRRAIEALLEPGPGRSETVQRLFSLDYDPDWRGNLGVRRDGSA